MLKQILNSFILLNVLLLASCGTTKPVSDADSNAETQEKQTFTGDYHSTTGVMTPLSCYCSDGGALLIGENDKISVCFDSMKEKPDDCKQLTVTGHFETLSNEPESTSPCPKGTMEVFVVESFKCK
ncbi:MAG: hypothetical protein QE487_16850 [Fluviicola sp.]|nr:hypothetical protein [Fluviicola sp.]